MGAKGVPRRDGESPGGLPGADERGLPREPSGQVVDVDRLYDVLANQRRRFALYYLKRHPEGVTLGELTERVAAWEDGCTPEDVSSEQRKRVYTALQQSHLPSLEEASIVTYDEDRRFVEPTEALATIECYPTTDTGDSTDWSARTLGLAAASIGVLALGWLGIWPVAALSPLAVATVIVVAFGLLALGQWHDVRRRARGADAPPPELE
ncbi:DUF7344 domain-containing protein [Halovivax limisalsi]|uniref:DUF7344 domain-containing protein n=1 Tax=Halovivax limisalsi TaxID=1453760 RepID=UPI001FFDCE92|nr:DUF308 domain-containing protein [Halovivax limisalsi]